MIWCLNIRAMRTGLPDLVDAEICRGDDITYMMVEAAHGQGMKVIASNHDFSRTPKKEELMRRLCKMQEMEAEEKRTLEKFGNHDISLLNDVE